MNLNSEVFAPYFLIPTARRGSLVIPAGKAISTLKFQCLKLQSLNFEICFFL